jgi:hypothetical protein
MTMKGLTLGLPEIVRVFVRFNHVASIIVNANHRFEFERRTQLFIRTYN